MFNNLLKGFLKTVHVSVVSFPVGTTGPQTDIYCIDLLIDGNDDENLFQ